MSQRRYGQETRIGYTAYNTLTGEHVDEAVTLHTITLTRDGVDAVAAGTKHNLGDEAYEVEISATEIQVADMRIRGTSSTPGVRLYFYPGSIQTVKLPNVTPGEINGLPILHQEISESTGSVLTLNEQFRLQAIETDSDLIPEVKAKTDLIGSGDITWTSPSDEDGNITVRRNRDYSSTDGLAVEFANADGTWADLTGATVTMLVARPGQVMADYSFAMSVVTPTGANQLVRLELTAAQLAIEANDYVGEVVATLASGRKVTLTEGSFEVLLGREEPA